MIEQIGTALLNNGPIGILCVVLWLQTREAAKREGERIKREEDRLLRTEADTRNRTLADLEVAKGFTILASDLRSAKETLSILADRISR